MSEIPITRLDTIGVTRLDDIPITILDEIRMEMGPDALINRIFILDEDRRNTE
jgi:hypothetical protein